MTYYDALKWQYLNTLRYTLTYDMFSIKRKAYNKWKSQISHSSRMMNHSIRVSFLSDICVMFETYTNRKYIRIEDQIRIESIYINQYMQLMMPQKLCYF